MTSFFRVLFLLIWIPWMLLGAVVCLFWTGLAVGWSIMASWIETVEP